MNMRPIGVVVRKILRHVGYELRIIHVNTSERARFAAQLQHHNVNLVLDVGANIGQFGRELRNWCAYRGRIVSFEPLQAAHDALSAVARKDALWEVAPRVAIGAMDGEVEINVSGNSMSSSILPMLESHAAAAPQSRYVGVEKTDIRQLDSVAFDYIRPGSNSFLKVDTQGYEQQVLMGATRVLSEVVGVQLELSFIPLYSGQKLAVETIQWMRDAGFDLWGMAPSFVEPGTGRILQVDGIFFRRK